jgi:hypothetical protein
MTRDDMIAAIGDLREVTSGLAREVADLKTKDSRIIVDLALMKSQLDQTLAQSTANAKVLENINRIVVAGGLFVSVVKILFAIVIGVTTIWVAVVNLHDNGAFTFIEKIKFWK